MNNEMEQWNDGLLPRESKFIECYVSGDTSFNAKQSYLKAYSTKNHTPSEKTALVNGCRLLKKDKIKKAMALYLKEIQEGDDTLNSRRILKEIAELAFFNPAEIIDSNGALKAPIEELGEKAKCIQQINITPLGPVVTLVNKSKYIELLTKYLNLIRPEVQVDVKLPVVEVVAKTDIDSIEGDFYE